MGRAADDDTSAEVARLQRAIHRRMTPARKIALVAELNALSDGFALAGLRAAHPDADEAELRLRLLVRKYGRDLVEAAYGRAPRD